MEWIPTGTGHQLAVRDGKIVARNDKGKELASVPAAAKKSDAFDDLDALLTFLHAHDVECGAEVERWFLQSLPVPRAVLAELWADDAWRSWLTDLIVATADGDLAGFLRAATPDGLGVVDLDGESVTIDADRVLIAHPAVIPDIDDLREFAVELGIQQRFDQLFREVFRKPDPAPDGAAMADWAGAEFEQLRFATARATGAGFKVSGGYATTTIEEADQRVVALYWIGADAPDYATVTDDLVWTIDDVPVPIADLGPVAYSEGVRMASHIYAGRKVEEDKQ